MSEKPLDIEVAILTASFDAMPGCEQELAAVLAQYTVMTRHEPGCRNVDLVFASTNTGRFLTIQKWESNDVARAHLDSEVMVAMAQEALPLLSTKPTLDLWDSISAHDLA